MASTGLHISEGNTRANVELLMKSAGNLMQRVGKCLRYSDPLQKRSFLRPLGSACQVTGFVEGRNTVKLRRGSFTLGTNWVS